MVIICDDDGPTSIAGIMGGQRSEVRDTTTRVLMEAATWNGPNIQRTSTRLALRSEASNRFEKGLQPEQGIDGQALAAILMIELTGARLAGGTIDVGGPGAGCRDDPPARRADGAAARHRDPARRGGGDPAAARVRRGRGRRRPRRHRAVLPPRRRHARGRPRRGGRAHAGAREAAGDAAVAPRGDRRARRPSSGCAAAPRTRWPAPACTRSLGWTFASPELVDACAARGRPAARGRGAAQPDVRGAVGAAHDDARLAARRGQAQPRARDARRPAVRDRRDLPRPGRAPASRPPPSGASSRCPRSASTSPRC